MASLNYIALLKKAYSAASVNDWVQAHSMCQDLLAERKSDPELLSLLARCCVRLQREAEAVQHCERCIKLQPKNLEHRVRLGFTFTRMGQYKRAIQTFERARRIDHDSSIVVGGLADALEYSGDSSRARELLEPYINAETEDPYMAVVWGRIAISDKNPEEAVRVLTRHTPPPETRTHYYLTLGRAYERSGQFKDAYEAYSSAKPKGQFKLDEFSKRISELMNAFSPTVISRIPKPSTDTSKLIFVVGMPRSGTTLIEKILDSHHDVTGLGELAHISHAKADISIRIGSLAHYPMCVADMDQSDVDTFGREYIDEVRRIAPKAKYTVNKSLDNLENLGLISVLFPDAKIIHVQRNTLDNCWSCFVSDLTYSWSAELKALGITHRIYEKLMDHWHEAIPQSILDVDYESIVTDQDGWTRKILDFCGLPWDERCLRFYEQDSAQRKNSVSAPTLSYDQVRQPIYTSSIGRYKRFEPYLDELRTGLEEGKRLAASLGSDLSQIK